MDEEIIGITHESCSVWVNKDGITSIKAIEINGHMAAITVFDIYEHYELKQRIYPHGHHIHYMDVKNKP